jgi:hypothetical protein
VCEDAREHLGQGLKGRINEWHSVVTVSLIVNLSSALCSVFMKISLKKKSAVETRSRDQMSNALEKSGFAKNERKFYIRVAINKICETT